MRCCEYTLFPSGLPGPEVGKTGSCHWAPLCAKHCAQTVAQVIRPQNGLMPCGCVLPFCREETEIEK